MSVPEMNIPELPSHNFTWELHCLKKDYSLTELLNDMEDTVRKEHTVLGYADAGNIPFRPKPGMFAVMIETCHGEKTWCHVAHNPNRKGSSENSVKKQLTNEPKLGYTRDGD